MISSAPPHFPSTPPPFANGAGRTSPAFDPFWIGLTLLARKTITQAQYEGAVQRYKAAPRGGFTGVLETLGLASAQQIAGLIAEKYGLPVVDLGAISLPKPIVRKLPQSKAKAKVAVPFKFEGDLLHVALADRKSTRLNSSH